MKRVRVVVIGTGFGRTVQGVAFRRHPGFELSGIAGSDPERTAAAAAALGVAGFTDWTHMIEQVCPDLVSVVSPVHLHHPMMLAAIERGAHVLCEKPTALNRFQAAEMHDRAIAAQRVAAINHEFRFFPARQFALELVRQGAIGTPRRGEILGRYAIWPRPESRPMTWLSDRRRGGGILGALGSHHTDCLRRFFGEPRRVLASVRVDQPRRGIGAAAQVATADDGCTLLYEFEGGSVGLVDLSASTPYRWERFEIHGTEATLRWDETGYRLWRISAGHEAEELEIPLAYALDRQEGDPALVAPFRILLDRLHRAVVAGEVMEPNFYDAVAVQSALDAARASAEAGTRVAVDLPALVSPEAGPRP